MDLLQLCIHTQEREIERKCVDSDIYKRVMHTNDCSIKKKRNQKTRIIGHIKKVYRKKRNRVHRGCKKRLEWEYSAVRQTCFHLSVLADSIFLIVFDFGKKEDVFFANE